MALYLGTDKVAGSIGMSQDIALGGKAVRTGRIVGGKIEYVKRFDIGGLPNNSRNIISLDMPNPEEIALIDIRGTAKKTTYGYEDIIPISTIVTTFLYRSSEKKLYVDTTSDQSSYNGYVEIYFAYK